MAESVKVAADVVILTIRDNAFRVLLITRGTEPFKGRYALPGGFLERGESVDETARRELFEETGVDAAKTRLDQIAVYSDPERDPRKRVISVAYSALVPGAIAPEAGGDAAAAHWIPVDEALQLHLAFDHDLILRAAVEHARHALEYTAAAAAFCEEEFTISELRRVYDIIWGARLDPGNFHRKVTRIPDFVEPTGATTTRDGGRPAALYRSDSSRRLEEFLARPRRDRESTKANTTVHVP